MKRYLLTIKLAISGIFANKARAFLTMLGIIIGVGSVIAIMAIGEGAQSLITGALKNMGTNLMAIIPGASDDSGPPASAMGIQITTLTYDDAQAVERIPHVIGVSAYSRGSGEIVYNNRSILGNFSGVTADFPKVENIKTAKGRFFTAKEEKSIKKVAVLGQEIKEELFPFTNPLGKKIKINNQKFQVIGILEKKGSSIGGSTDSQIFLPLSVAQKNLLGVHHLGMIRFKIDNEKNIDIVKERVKRTLRRRHGIKNSKDDDFTVRSMVQALEVFDSVTNALKLFLSCIAAISLIVGGIGITNIMLMTVKERTQEIGLRKAIGARPSQIKNQFILEALVITGLGGIIGIIGGTLLSYIVAVVARMMDYNWDFIITPSSVLTSFFVSVFIGVVFGIYPAKKAAELNPIDALRYE